MACPFLRIRVHRRNPRLAFLDIQVLVGEETAEWSEQEHQIRLAGEVT